ncbi:unnamed protein product [Rhizophagus irregularis]|nr:unnamed protein product [Rhizophagus irregularis]
MYFLDCWNYEPENRPTANQVVSRLDAIVPKNNNIIINDFQLDDSHTNIQSSNNEQYNSNASEDSSNKSYSSNKFDRSGRRR